MTIWVNEVIHDEEALRVTGTLAVEIGGFSIRFRLPLPDSAHDTALDRQPEVP